MDTVYRIGTYCMENDYDIVYTGIPKTVDNDLVGTDHSPGFPSAARCNILNVLQAGQLARDMKRVDRFVIYQTIGRNAGWLAAATALAKRKEDDAPHLIYCPERLFYKERFINDANEMISKYGWVSIVVSEGLKFPDGNLVSLSQNSSDSTNYEYGAMGGGSAGIKIHQMLANETGFRGEFQITESLIMSAIDRAVSIDKEEAFQCGTEAVKLALKGESGYMVSIKRLSDHPYQISFEQKPLQVVALKIKTLPDDFINAQDNFVTEKLYEYMRPLVGDIPGYFEIAADLQDILYEPKG